MFRYYLIKFSRHARSGVGVPPLTSIKDYDNDNGDAYGNSSCNCGGSVSCGDELTCLS